MVSILGNLADVLFLGGKSFNFMREVDPGHFICSDALPVQHVALTLSLEGLRAVKRRRFEYVGAINALAGQHTAERRAKVEAKEQKRLEEVHRAAVLAFELDEAKREAANRRAAIAKAKKAKQMSDLDAGLAAQEAKVALEQKILQVEELKRQEYKREVS